jgi:sugar lactone lactonase YvrE
MKPFRAATALSLALSIVACRTFAPAELPAPGELVEVAASPDLLWTGLAISPTGRKFVSFPRWGEPIPFSVAEVMEDGSLRPYPDETWNSWTPESGSAPVQRWVCVQALHFDGDGRLWVLDPGSPGFGGVIPGAAKLVQIDVHAGRAVRQIVFDASVAPPHSYLNDVRVDADREFAYVTDSAAGAIVVVDLAQGVARRVLEGHPSVAAEPISITVEGVPLVMPNGEPPRVASDGIALDRRGAYLYWQALTGRTLYRIPTALLRDESLSPARLASEVVRLGETVVTDGMEIDEHDNVYFTAIESDAIVVRRRSGVVETLVRDARLAWPDSLAWGPDGALYVTTAQIHRSALVRGAGTRPSEPYRILKLAPAGW